MSPCQTRQAALPPRSQRPDQPLPGSLTAPRAHDHPVTRPKTPKTSRSEVPPEEPHPYDFIDADRRQVCLGHLARNFQAFAERPGACGRHGQAIRALIDDAIRADTQARCDGRTLSWSSGPLHDIHNRLMDALQAGERSHTPDLARLCATILDIWPTLWNFTEHPDAEANEQPR